MTQPLIFVGIDVSKAQLDVALRPTGRFVVPHDDSGIAQLLERLKATSPTLIVLEATGGVEVPLTSALAATGLPVVVVNPRQIRDFAKAVGQLAKTDALDAQVLAHFADVVRPTPRPLPDAQTQELAALVTRRRQLIEMLTAEKNRIASARIGIRKQLRAHITWLVRALGSGRHRLGQGHSAESGLARERGVVAERPRHRPGLDDHTAGKFAGIGHVDTQTDRRPRRRGAAQSG
jgi:transposase